MSWAHYLLQVNFYLVIFYGFYKLLLDRETYFILNRIYLLLAGGLSLSIPFLRFEWFVNHPVAQPLYVRVDQLNDLMSHVSVMQDAPEYFHLGNTIVFIYLIGIFFFTIKFIYKLYKVQQLLKKVESGNAYTFLNKKIIDQELPGVMVIDKHEEIHIRQFHTLDIIFFELVNIFTWFNPIIYLYKHTIRNIHEYLADEEAAKFQGDKEAYALLLLSSAFGISPSNLTSTFFNKSLLKKRIFMLHKQRSRRTAILKYGLFLPIFALTLILSSATIRQNENLLAVAEEIPLNTPFISASQVINNPIEIAISSNKKKPLKSIEKQDQNWDQFYSHIKKSIRYPEKAIEKDLQGNTQISFKVKNGHLSQIRVLKKLGEGCDGAAMKLIWSYPGFKTVQDGSYSINIGFRINGSMSTVKNLERSNPAGYTPLKDIVTSVYAPPPVAKNNMRATKPEEEAANVKKEENAENKIYDFVSISTQPSFPGGMAKFYEYIKKTIKYPQAAEKNNVEGKVYLSFTVEKNGALADIRVDRKLGSGTDEEAVRVLTISPNWEPGINDGLPVRVRYNMMIAFTLAKDKVLKEPAESSARGNTK